MTKCKWCNSELKPLFTSLYCPRGCDTPEGAAKREAALAALKEALEKAQRPWFTVSLPLP